MLINTTKTLQIFSDKISTDLKIWGKNLTPSPLPSFPACILYIIDLPVYVYHPGSQDLLPFCWPDRHEFPPQYRRTPEKTNQSIITVKLLLTEDLDVLVNV